MKFELFIYRNADKVLREKELYLEIKSILGKITVVDQAEIQKEFKKRSWLVEKRIFPLASWAWDAYKDDVAVSVELNSADAMHRDFLRAMLAHKQGHLDVLVCVASIFREPKFQNVKKDIELFGKILNFPILLIGFC